jgi:hypothetical protein
MLLSILLAASLLPSQQASMHCIDRGSEIAAAQTQPVRGLNGVTAVLKVGVFGLMLMESPLTLSLPLPHT